jgi:ribosomal protein S3
LGGEKIDIIAWNDNAEKFISSSLSPAKILEVEVDQERRTARVTVAEDQLSLAIGKGGQKFEFHAALPVDASGVLPDGRAFADIREFKRLLLADEVQLARNLARQLTVFATGAPIGFSDRVAIEQILQRSRAQHYGVRTLVREIVQSPLFLRK